MFELANKWRLCFGIFFTLLPMYSWYRFFKMRKQIEEDVKNVQLFYDRHNCVVMYRKNCSPAGWPNPNQTQPQKLLVRTDIYDSILYFIRTADKSIDIAMMLINTKALIDALVEAQKRKVTIRILLDHEYNKRSKIKDLQNAGVQVMYYVCPEANVSSILHYKYMVKDYHKGKGFVYVGSLNWTMSGIQDNYENTVFISDSSVVKAFHQSFEEAWLYVTDTNKTSSYVKAKLSGVQ